MDTLWIGLRTFINDTKSNIQGGVLRRTTQIQIGIEIGRLMNKRQKPDQLNVDGTTLIAFLQRRSSNFKTAKETTKSKLFSNSITKVSQSVINL